LPAPLSLSLSSIHSIGPEIEREKVQDSRYKEVGERDRGGRTSKKRTMKKGDARVPRYEDHEITHVSVECLQEFLLSFISLLFSISLCRRRRPIEPLSSLLPPVLSHPFVQLKAKQARPGRETSSQANWQQSLLDRER
jgi:hypothetical protein